MASAVFQAAYEGSIPFTSSNVSKWLEDITVAFDGVFYKLSEKF